MQYYGTRLSENISRREPEGYLLCLNVPVARSGTQDYLPQELGLPQELTALCRPEYSQCHSEYSQCHPERSEGSSSPGLIHVYRPESEVFSPETIASFEGMPVTNDHPPDGVDIDNIRQLQMGHAHNVRRGSREESDLLLADLIITDPRLIDLILSGKREISCGYNYELHEENGRYVQRKIRGNHIAVVDAGRAGRRVSIKDSQAAEACRSGHPGPRYSERNRGISPFSAIQTPERRKPMMKKSLTKLLARMAKDGDIETVAELIEAIAEEHSEASEAIAEAAAEGFAETVPEAAEGEAVTIEVVGNEQASPAAENPDAFTALLQRLDQLIALLSAGLAPSAGTENVGNDDPVEEMVEEMVEETMEAVKAENAENAAAEEIAGMMEAIAEPAVSVTLEQKEEDCGDPDSAAAKDALRAALQTFRPVLSKMNPRERRTACAELAANLRSGRRTGDSGIYAFLASGRKPAAENLSDLGRRIMASRNPNYKK